MSPYLFQYLCDSPLSRRLLSLSVQVSQVRTVSTTSTTVPVTAARMGVCVWMVWTPTTAAARLITQVTSCSKKLKLKHLDKHLRCACCTISVWTVLGQYCTENVDECELMPNACQNGGTCHDTHGSYHCVCVNGWTGDDCSENIDDCASAACYHGATCHDRVASFFCECPHGRTGMSLKPTSSLVATQVFTDGNSNVMTVIHLKTHRHVFVWTGLLCHLDDACISNPCQKGSNCDTNPVNGKAICTCPPGYTGSACNLDIDECSLGMFKCQCIGHL